MFLGSGVFCHEGRDPQEVNVGDSSPSAITLVTPGVGHGQCARSFQHQAGKHPCSWMSIC